MKITKIETGETSQGKPMWYIHFDDGKKYGWFDQPKVKVGDDVLCEYKQNGKYTNLVGMRPVETVNMASSPTAAVGTQSIVMEQKLKPHSYEIGASGDRHKIYYETIEELQAHLVALQEVGLISQDLAIEEKA